MKIFIAGDERRTESFRRKLKGEIVASSEIPSEGDFLSTFDMVANLNADDERKEQPYFLLPAEKIVMACSVKKSLSQMVHESGGKVSCSLVGLNGLPTFLDRQKMEVSFLNPESKKRFESFAKEIDVDFIEVEDRTGMVTPRVICMIINEACYTLQEGTADLQDIDKGMKLGTNYPFGPFEWCDQIGIKDVYETLEAVWNDTHDERYKICPLLKTRYLRGEPFYS